MPRIVAAFQGKEGSAVNVTSYTQGHDPEILPRAVLGLRHGEMGPSSHEDMAPGNAQDVGKMGRLLMGTCGEEVWPACEALDRVGISTDAS